MLLVAAVLGLAGCSRGTDYDSSLPAVTTTTAKSAKPMIGGNAGSGSEAEILAGYRSYWRALITAGATADATSPLLPAHATGLALEQARAHFAELKRLGQVDRGTVALHPRLVAVRDAAATVEDCPDTSHWLRQDARTGALRETIDSQRVKYLVVLFLIDQTWKVTNVTGKGRCQS
jgi:hypothetical protein